jgi:hypothetical protein
MSRLEAVCLLGVCLLTQCLSAEEAATAADAAAPKLETTVRVAESTGRETIRHACFALGPNRFAFVIPPGFRLDTATAEKVVLVNNDFSCLISLRIAAPTPPEARREDVLTQYPGAKILGELTFTAANQTGPAFDLQCSPGGVVRSVRVAFIPSPAGVLEFTLLCSPDKFRGFHGDFDFLLQTLRTSDATRELKMVQLADQS